MEVSQGHPWSQQDCFMFIAVNIGLCGVESLEGVSGLELVPVLRIWSGNHPVLRPSMWVNCSSKAIRIHVEPRSSTSKSSCGPQEIVDWWFRIYKTW
jgi:hypothetical protein